MTFAGFERLESRKSLFPPLVTKTRLIQLSISPVVEVIMAVALNSNPLAEAIAVFHMKAGNDAVPFALFETTQGGKAPIPNQVKDLSVRGHKVRIVAITFNAHFIAN